MNLALKYIIIITYTLLFTGCYSVLRGYMGVKKSKPLTDKQIIRYAKKYGVPQSEVFKLDTTKFRQIIEGIQDSSIRKDWGQPLQVKSFNSEGVSNAHLINCTVNGFPKANWNYWGAFNNFPMNSGGGSREIDTSLGLKSEISLILPLNDNTISYPDLEKSDEILVIYWNRTMHKRSKEMIKYVHTYRENNGDKTIVAFYINTDNWYKDLFHN